MSLPLPDIRARTILDKTEDVECILRLIHNSDIRVYLKLLESEQERSFRKMKKTASDSDNRYELGFIQGISYALALLTKDN